MNVTKPSDYDSCPDCKGFQHKKQIWHQARKFLFNKAHLPENSLDKGNVHQRQYRTKSVVRIMNESNINVIESFKQVLINRWDDDIGLVTKGDDLILQVGQWEFERSGLVQGDTI